MHRNGFLRADVFCHNPIDYEVARETLGNRVHPPFLLVTGASLGGALATVTLDYPAVFVGFIAFSIVALLFLVTQELLIEAHENSDGVEVWWINVWLFIGVLIVLMIEKVDPA